MDFKEFFRKWQSQKPRNYTSYSGATVSEGSGTDHSYYYQHIGFVDGAMIAVQRESNSGHDNYAWSKGCTFDRKVSVQVTETNWVEVSPKTHQLVDGFILPI